MTIQSPPTRHASAMQGAANAKERALLERARAGEDVREEVILYVQRCIQGLAFQFARSIRYGQSVDAQDLIHSAILAMLKQFDKALTKEKPFGFLIQTARYTMLNIVSSGREDFMKARLPHEPLSISSLDAPIGDEDGFSLVDFIPCEVQLRASASETAEENRYQRLYQVIEALPEIQRFVIEHHYGLGCAPQSLNEISKRLSLEKHRPSQAKYHHKQALQALHKQLAADFPQYNEESDEERGE